VFLSQFAVLALSGGGAGGGGAGDGGGGDGGGAGGGDVLGVCVRRLSLFWLKGRADGRRPELMSQRHGGGRRWQGPRVLALAGPAGPAGRPEERPRKEEPG